MLKSRRHSKNKRHTKKRQLKRKSRQHSKSKQRRHTKRQYKRQYRGGVAMIQDNGEDLISPDGNVVKFNFTFEHQEPLNTEQKQHLRDVLMPDYLGNQNIRDSFIGYNVVDSQLNPDERSIADLIFIRVSFDGNNNTISVEGEIESYNEEFTRQIIYSTKDNLPIQLKRISDDGFGIELELVNTEYIVEEF
jgi:hypothetical protein